MAKTKSILLCLLALLSMSAVASSSASAGTHNFIIEGTEIKGTEEIEQTGQFGDNPDFRRNMDGDKLEYTIGGIRVIQECRTSTYRVILGANGVSSQWKFLGQACTMREFVGGREIITPCIATEKDEGNDLLTAAGNDQLKPLEKSEIFGTVELEGCALAGKYEIKGEESCAIPEAMFEKAIHTMICTSTGSSLKINSEPAWFFQAGQVKLTSNKAWSTN